MRRLGTSGTVPIIDQTSSVNALQQITDILRGIQADLSQVITEYNSEVYPVLSTLPQGASDSNWSSLTDAVYPNRNGFDGTQFFLDRAASSSTDGGRYFRTDVSRPKTVKEVLNHVYSEINNGIDAIRAEVASLSTSGVSSAAQNRIGINIFDSTQASSSDSLDGLTASNQRHILQLARDVYDDDHDSWTATGTPLLTNYSVRDMLDALLQLHSGAYNSDISLTHPASSFYSSFTGATNEETDSTTEVVIGGFSFDPSQWGSTAGLYLYFTSVFSYIAAGAAGSGLVRLYDLGTPGAVGAGTLRSTLTRTHLDANATDRERVALTAVSSPSATNEIHNAERVYELRILTDGTGDPTDIVRVVWAGIMIEPV